MKRKWRQVFSRVPLGVEFARKVIKIEGYPCGSCARAAPSIMRGLKRDARMIESSPGPRVAKLRLDSQPRGRPPRPAHPGILRGIRKIDCARACAYWSKTPPCRATARSPWRVEIEHSIILAVSIMKRTASRADLPPPLRARDEIARTFDIFTGSPARSNFTSCTILTRARLCPPHGFYRACMRLT